MSILSTFSRWEYRRRPLAVFTVLVIGALAAYQMAQYVINDDMTGLAYGGLCVAGLVIVIAILNNWRNGLYLFLGWLLFEDFARKFLGNNMMIYFAKDLLLLTVLVSFVTAVRRKEVTSFRPPFLTALLIFIWFGALQIFNPASTHIMYGLMGFKIFFYYVPLFFIGYALLNSEAELRRFFIINLILILIIISLGIMQSIIGPSFLNPAVQAEDLRELSGLYRVAPISGAMAYRPTSVFVSTGRYVNFIMVAWMIVLGFGGYLLLRHKRGRALAFIALPVTAAGAFLSTSRGSFLWAALNALTTSAAFIWGAPWKQGEVRRVLRSVQRFALGIGLGLVLLFYFYPDALLSRLAVYEETLSPSSGASELVSRGWTYPVQNFLVAFDYDRWLYGYGIGTTALGGQYVARFFNAKPPAPGVESGFGTLVVEMGIGGLMFWIVMTVAILLSAWRVVKKLKGSPWFPLGFAVFWYALFLLVFATYGGIQPYEDYLLNAYLWLLLGLLFRLPSIKLSAEFAINAAAGPARRHWIR